MRDLKFKVWNVEDKKMYEPFNLYHELSENSALGENENIVILQFAGVKDDNGKDIYENDILKDAEGVIWEVKYVMAGFSMYCTSAQLFSKVCLKENTEEEQIALDIGAWWAGTEVIGNSYENPELLKDALVATGEGEKNG